MPSGVLRFSIPGSRPLCCRRCGKSWRRAWPESGPDLRERGPDLRYRETDADLIWTSEAVRKMISDRTLADIAAGLLGGDVDVRFCFTLTKTAEHGEPVLRHQDWGLGTEPGYPFFTCWIALTDADAGNGCLEVLPGSHSGPLHPHAATEGRPQDKGIPGMEAVDALAVPMKAGEAMIIHPALIHGSGRNRTGQPRMALLTGYQAPKPEYDEFWGRSGARLLRGGRPAWGPLSWK